MTHEEQKQFLGAEDTSDEMKEWLFAALDLDNRIKLLAIDEKTFSKLKGSPEHHQSYFHVNDFDRISNEEDEGTKNSKLRNHIKRV